MATVINGRAFREKASDSPSIDRQRGGTRLRTAAAASFTAGERGER